MINIEVKKDKLSIIASNKENYYVFENPRINLELDYKNFFVKNTFDINDLINYVLKETNTYNYLNYLEITIDTDFFDILYENDVKYIIMPKHKKFSIFFNKYLKGFRRKKEKYLIDILFKYNDIKYDFINIFSNYAPIRFSNNSFSFQEIKKLYIDLSVNPFTDDNEIDLSKLIVDKDTTISLSRFKKINGYLNKDINYLKLKYTKISKHIFQKINNINKLKLESIDNINKIAKILPNININNLIISGFLIENADMLKIKEIDKLELNNINKLEIKNIIISKCIIKNSKKIQLEKVEIDDLTFENNKIIDLFEIKVLTLKINNFKKFTLIDKCYIKNGNIKNGLYTSIIDIYLKDNLYINNIKEVIIKNIYGKKLSLNNIKDLLIEYETRKKKPEKIKEIIDIIDIHYIHNVKINIEFNHVIKKEIENNSNISYFDFIKKIKLYKGLNIILNLNNYSNQKYKKGQIFYIYLLLLLNIFELIKNNLQHINNLKIKNNIFSDKLDDLIHIIKDIINNKKTYNEISIKKRFVDLLNKDFELLLKDENLIPDFYRDTFYKKKSKTSSKLKII